MQTNSNSHSNSHSHSHSHQQTALTSTTTYTPTPTLSDHMCWGHRIMGSVDLALVFGKVQHMVKGLLDGIEVLYGMAGVQYGVAGYFGVILKLLVPGELRGLMDCNQGCLMLRKTNTQLDKQQSSTQHNEKSTSIPSTTNTSAPSFPQTPLEPQAKIQQEQNPQIKPHQSPQPQPQPQQSSCSSSSSSDTQTSQSSYSNPLTKILNRSKIKNQIEKRQKCRKAELKINAQQKSPMQGSKSSRLRRMEKKLMQWISGYYQAGEFVDRRVVLTRAREIGLEFGLQATNKWCSGFIFRNRRLKQMMRNCRQRKQQTSADILTQFNPETPNLPTQQ